MVWMFWNFENTILHIFTNFWVSKLKPFSGKLKKNVKNCLNQNLVIGRFLKTGFEATFSSKANVLKLENGIFWLFCKYLNDEVETIFWESEEKFLHKLYFLRNVLENTFQLHFGHSNVLNVLNVSIWISNWSYSSYSITIIRNQLRYLLWAVPQFNLMFLFISYFKLFVTLGSSSQLYLLSKWPQNCLSWLEKISRVDKFLCFSLLKNRKTTIVNAKIISLICIANKAIGASVFGESYLLK